MGVGDHIIEQRGDYMVPIAMFLFSTYIVGSCIYLDLLDMYNELVDKLEENNLIYRLLKSYGQEVM